MQQNYIIMYYLLIIRHITMSIPLIIAKAKAQIIPKIMRASTTKPIIKMVMLIPPLNLSYFVISLTAVNSLTDFIHSFNQVTMGSAGHELRIIFGYVSAKNILLWCAYDFIAFHRITIDKCFLSVA